MRKSRAARSVGRRRVAEVVADIRQRIASGQYLPHHFLPTERQLAQEYHASGRTIALAVDALVEAGLLRQKRGRGTQVVSPAERSQAGGVAVVHALWPGGLTEEGRLILRGVEDTLGQLGCPYAIIPWTTPHEFTRMGNVTVTLYDDLPGVLEQYDGFLFIEATSIEAHIAALADRRVPLVVANLEQEMAVSATRMDHRKVFRFAVEILAALGHRRVALITRSPEMYYHGKAILGYWDGVRSTGIVEDPGLARTVSSVGVLDAYFAATELLGAESPPTAIVVSRDMFAMGVCRAISERGLTLGRDVSVIGFGDIGWAGDPTPLTTFREPCHELGAQAVRMLYDRLVNGWRPPEQVELEPELVLRRSVSACPGAEGSPGVPGAVLLRPVWPQASPAVSAARLAAASA